MAKFKKKKEEHIFLYNKKVKISKLVATFVVIPAFEIIKYLQNKEIYLPYYIHKALIRKNIAPAIADAESANKFSDEMQYRLKWFDDFTIFQLELLAKNYQLPIDVNEYKKDFWDLIVRHRTELRINNLEFIKLQNLTLKYANNEQESYEEMMESFDQIYFEPVGYFNGTEIEKAKEVLNNATTLAEIRRLGDEYGVEIPRRINKKQLIDIVAIKLGFDEDKKAEIAKKSILEIERYAKRRKVNVSVELKKSDMIDYILIKMPQEEKPKYSRSLKVFADMNIEEYLYNLKFEEIAQKVKDAKKNKFKKIGAIVIIIAVLGFIGYLVYSQFLL